MVVAMLREIIGDEHYTQLLADKVSMTELMQLSKWIAEQCGLDLEDDGKAASNGGPPVLAPTRSSKTGPPSKLTSGASTG